MEDLPIPESSGETIGIIVVVAIIAGLYFFVRRTQREHYRKYWEQRRFYENHRLSEPTDPSQLSTTWERVERDDPDTTREAEPEPE